MSIIIFRLHFVCCLFWIFGTKKDAVKRLSSQSFLLSFNVQFMMLVSFFVLDFRLVLMVFKTAFDNTRRRYQNWCQAFFLRVIKERKD